MNKIITADELRTILELHKKWLYNEPGGERANLMGADLYGANLYGEDLYGANLYGADLRKADLSAADLRGADLREANLKGANLKGANLYGADLRKADLRKADLRKADLREANLMGADLREANLKGANLKGADLYGANLYGANLYAANLKGADLRGADLGEADLSAADLREVDLRGAYLRGAKNIPFIPMACPDTGSYIAYKKVHGFIVKLEIPSDALRSSATGRKCRANKAKVLAIENMDGTISDVDSCASIHDPSFVYRVGEVVEVNNFDTDRWNECAPGIHHFINRQEAVNYIL